jgi:ABC-type Fe3+-citrate transport system substrate-binding protein
MGFAIGSADKEGRKMMKTIRILMVIVILLAAAACGSSGVDNGVSSQQSVVTQDPNDHGPRDHGPYTK